MDVLLAILCLFALLLLFVGQREGFTGDCGTDGSPPPATWGVLSVPMRVYTRTECEKNHNGIWYDAGMRDGLGVCYRKEAVGDSYDLSKACAFLNNTPAAPAAPAAPTSAVPPAPTVTSMTAPLPQAMPTPTGGNTITSLPIPGMPSVAPQAAGVMTSTPVGAPLGSGTPHGILLTIV